MTLPDALDPSFFARPAERVAKALLGMLLVSLLDDLPAIGRIVETEAYLGLRDPASHAAERIGRTARNETMYGAPGHAYVYRSYGIHWCMNAVTDAVGKPGAVLLRAIEPVAGIDVMRQRRWSGGASGRDTLIGSGPGRLAMALGITGMLDGHRLDQAPLYVAAGEPVSPRRIDIGPRIGISRAVDWPLRFTIRGNAHISR